MSDDVQAFDVVIVGGGLVGAALALALARQQVWRILLVEKTVFSQDTLETLSHPSFDARNTALSNGTCELYDQLGLWSGLKPHAQAITHIEVSDQGAPGLAVIDAASERVAALGYVIENRWIGHATLEALRDHPQVMVRDGAEFSSAQPCRGGFSGYVTQGDVRMGIRASLLVVADGADSVTCRQLGIGFRREPYAQAGIVTTLRTDSLHAGWAWERFTPQGPLALLPQTGERLGVTWCVDTARADSLMSAPDDVFLAALQAEAGGRAGYFTSVGRRFCYPLRKAVADEQIRPHLVVLGNAAHAMHPVAGQGLNMALRDVVELARLCADAHYKGVSPGEFALLSHYFGERQQDQAMTQQFADSLVKLFSRSTPAVKFARSLGLSVFDILPGAKHTLARFAMGRSVSMRIPGGLA